MKKKTTKRRNREKKMKKRNAKKGPCLVEERIAVGIGCVGYSEFFCLVLPALLQERVVGNDPEAETQN